MTSSAECERIALEAAARKARPPRVLVFPTYNGGELIVDPAEVAALSSNPALGAIGDPPEKWPTLITLRSGTQLVVDVPLTEVRKPLVEFWGVAWPSDRA